MALKSISMKDIAAETGVSASTISRILNGYKSNFSVKPEIREKVIACVKARGYNPNPVFKSLRAAKTKQIALLLKPEYASLPTMGQVVNSAIEHIAPLLMKRGYSLNFHFNSTDMSAPWEPPLWKVDGAIVPNVETEDSLRLLEGSGLPFVCLNGVAGGKGASVMIDEYSNTALAVKKLYELGHRRIAYASAKALKHYSVWERADAFLGCLKELGLKPANELDRITEFDPEGFLEEAVIKRKATALIVYDHFRAVKYLNAAWRLGIEVPRRLSVITFNDDYLMRWSIPPMTCVGNNASKAGEEAMNLLLDHIEKGREIDGVKIRVKGCLVERESVAQAPEGP